MTTTTPTRIDDDLYAAAKAAGKTMSRSAAQQIAHWTRPRWATGSRCTSSSCRSI